MKKKIGQEKKQNQKTKKKHPVQTKNQVQNRNIYDPTCQNYDPTCQKCCFDDALEPLFVQNRKRKFY